MFGAVICFSLVIFPVGLMFFPVVFSPAKLLFFSFSDFPSGINIFSFMDFPKEGSVVDKTVQIVEFQNFEITFKSIQIVILICQKNSIK